MSRGRRNDVLYALLQSQNFVPAKALSESGNPPQTLACAFQMKLYALLKTVTASAVFAVASVAHMNGVQLAVHTVLIETALCNTAGNAAVDFVFHSPLLDFYYAQFFKFY